jgi:hypothetical protein
VRGRDACFWLPTVATYAVLVLQGFHLRMLMVVKNPGWRARMASNESNTVNLRYARSRCRPSPE